MAWYDELQRRSTSAEIAVRLYEARNAHRRASTSRRGVTTPTLVAHARGDRAVPVEEGRLLAAPHPGRPVRPAGVGEPHPALRRAGLACVRVRAPRVPRHASRRRRDDRSTTLSPRELRGARAGGRGPDQRGDRRAAVPERPHGRAPPLQRLREAARVRQGGAGGRRRAFSETLRAGRHATPAGCVLAPMPARATARSVAPQRNAGRSRAEGGTEMERTLERRGDAGGRADRDARGARRRRAQAARAGVGRPAGTADRVRPRLVAVPAVLVAADRRPARRRLPARHLRPPRPRHVGEAAGRRAVRRRAAVGRRPQRRDRAARSWTGRCWSRGPTAGTSSPTTSRAYGEDGDRRRRPRRRRGAAHAHASTTSGRACSRTPATPARPTCRRASPPSTASCARARCGRSSEDDWSTALCWNMVVPPEVRGALFAREIDADDVLSRLSVPVLVTHGLADAIVLPSMARARARRVPDGAGLLVRRTSATCRSWRTPAGSTASSRVRARREQGGGDHAPGVRVRAVARRDARATLRR